MTKTERIATHLEQLRLAARPITITDTTGVRNPHGKESSISQNLYLLLQPVLVGATEAVDLEAIRQAALTRKEPIMGRPEYTPYYWATWPECPWQGTKDLWLYCLPALRAIVDMDNLRRHNEYEVYRLACEQGVAIPPEN